MSGTGYSSKVFFKLLLAVIVVVLFFSLADSNIQAADVVDKEQLAVFLDGVLQQQLAGDRISGAVISVVSDDQVVYQRGLGKACWDDGVKLDPHKHLMRAGSVGKIFTWTAILQQVERGNLELDRDINDYLPAKHQLEYDDNDNPVTLNNLMTHTGGFEDRGITLLAPSREGMLSLEEYLDEFGHPELVYEPGEIPAYSNYGTTLAGYILEEVSGRSYQEYIETEIFSPLWMKNSTARQPPPDNLQQNLSCGHSDKAGRFQPQEFEYIREAPAGGHSVTARDMTFFMRAIMPRNSEEDMERIWNILSESGIEKMFSPYYSSHPQAAGWSLGMMHQEFAGEELFWHGGDTGLFSSGLFFLPERDLGIFVAYNGGEGAFARLELMRALISEFYPGELETIDRESAQDLSRFAGSYYSSRSSHSTPEKILSRINRLEISAGEDKLVASDFREISYLSGEREYEFISQRGRHSLIFTRDENGEIDGVIRGENPTEVFFKLSPLESPILHLIIVIAAFFTYLFTIVVNIRNLFKGVRGGFSRRESLPVWPGILLSALGIIFVAVQSYFFYNLLQSPYGWPEWMGLVNLIPVVMLILLLVDIYQIIKKGFLRSNFINQVLLIIVSMAFLGVLYYYNFIGFLVFHP